MADEVEMTPVTGVEPPKVKPTLKMPPVVKPGLKLPTQTALKPGLKLPPKPGAALKPGLKLPTQTALKPGLKLPPKPVIRKPGAAPTAAPLPKPMEALKTVTQKLKGITQEIPQQAILHKTGIIAEGGAMSDAQKEAAKHKTARISLSDAMGAAPVKNEAAPMKTIRIKRPINIPTPTSSLTPQPPAPAATPAAPAAPAPAPTAAPVAEKPAEPAPTLTQRKTLKISRPGAKLTAKHPAPLAPAAAPAAEAAAEGGGEVADIADIPDVPNAPVPMAAPATDETGWAWMLSVLVQFAACVVLGALAWFLYQNTQTAYF